MRRAGADEQAVPVSAMGNSSETYSLGRRRGEAIARFTAATPGRYTIRVAWADSDSRTMRIAVGQTHVLRTVLLMLAALCAGFVGALGSVLWWVFARVPVSD